MLGTSYDEVRGRGGEGRTWRTRAMSSRVGATQATPTSVWRCVHDVHAQSSTEAGPGRTNARPGPRGDAERASPRRRDTGDVGAHDGGRGRRHDRRAQWGEVGPSARVVAPALLVMVLIDVLGPLAGAHVNSVVTLAFALRRAFSWRRAPGYWTTQVGGSVLAVILL